MIPVIPAHGKEGVSESISPRKSRAWGQPHTWSQYKWTQGRRLCLQLRADSPVSHDHRPLSSSIKIFLVKSDPGDTEMKRIIGEDYEPLYANELDYWSEMDEFLETPYQNWFMKK